MGIPPNLCPQLFLSCFFCWFVPWVDAIRITSHSTNAGLDIGASPVLFGLDIAKLVNYTTEKQPWGQSGYGGFPYHADTPSHHPFLDGIFHHKPFILGYLHLWNPPYSYDRNSRIVTCSWGCKFIYKWVAPRCKYPLKPLDTKLGNSKSSTKRIKKRFRKLGKSTFEEARRLIRVLCWRLLNEDRPKFISIYPVARWWWLMDNPIYHLSS